MLKHYPVVWTQAISFSVYGWLYNHASPWKKIILHFLPFHLLQAQFFSISFFCTESLLNYVPASSGAMITNLGLCSLSCGRLIARSCEISKPWDFGSYFSNGSVIWHAPQQPHCRIACQISERKDYYNTKSCGFATSRDSEIRRLNTLWIQALFIIVVEFLNSYSM